MNARDLDRRIRFERKTRPAGRGKAGQETWEPVDTVFAQVQDTLPSRAERLADGLTIAARPARIRIRYRDDLSSDMRVIYGDRTMEIMSPLAEIGRRQWLEFMAQDFSTQGTGA